MTTTTAAKSSMMTHEMYARTGTLDAYSEDQSSSSYWITTFQWIIQTASLASMVQRLPKTGQ